MTTKPNGDGFTMVAAKTIIWCQEDTVSVIVANVDDGVAGFSIVVPGRDHAWNIQVDQPLFGKIRNAMETAERNAEEQRKRISADGEWWRPSVIARRLGRKYA